MISNILITGDFSDVHKLEEKERERRINSPSEQQLARELASVASGRSLNKETEVEEQERGRRMKDVGAQKLAKENAKHVSLMVRESSSNKVCSTNNYNLYSTSRLAKININV